jgi:two-component system phosphate regulon response regulator PhoB
LVVNDAPPTRALVSRLLTSTGFVVDQAGDACQARQRLQAGWPDVVVLDVELRDASGFHLLQEIVASDGAPVVMLTGRGNGSDGVMSLELGAEDYLRVPFQPRELAVRVLRAAGRRRPPRALRWEYSGLIIDTATREVGLDCRAVDLTGREFDLLAYLAAAPRQVFSRDQLLRDVWHSSPAWQTSKTVTEHVRRVRQKIESDPSRPRWITTVARVGYRFEP